MADNVTAPGRGAVLATDEIEGVHWPLTKIAFGAENAVELVSTADPLPVSFVEAPLPEGAASEASLTALAEKLPTLGQKAASGSVSIVPSSSTPFHPPSVASGVAAVEGSLSTTGYSSAFTPVPGRPINLTLSGTFAGTVQLYRSFDGGTTKHPTTAGGQAWGTFTEPCSEPVWEEPESGVQLYVGFTRTSGTVAYRISQ